MEQVNKENITDITEVFETKGRNKFCIMSGNKIDVSGYKWKLVSDNQNEPTQVHFYKEDMNDTLSVSLSTLFDRCLKEYKHHLDGFEAKEKRRVEEEIREKAIEVINFLNLSHLTQELAGNLSGGQKKLLELGRTMMVDPQIVLLDEVGAGVNRTLLKDIGTSIQKLNKEQGYTFCMIEHDIDFISRLCDPVIVMAEGSVLFEGTSDEVKKNDRVIESYLGRRSITEERNS